MSVEHLAAALSLMDDRPLFKLLLIALAIHSDSHGRIETSLGELMSSTGMSERSVRKWIATGVKSERILRGAKPYSLRLL